MSIFSSILAKIFPSDHPAVTTASMGPAAAPTGSQTAPTPLQSTTAKAPAGPMPEVDVQQQLSAMAAKHGEQLNWRTSIVDLMKLLGLDSSLTARKQLAAELKYSGDMNDSAAMNIWLQKQVMSKLAANGGKVPDDLK